MGKKPRTTQKARPKRNIHNERNLEGYKNFTTKKAKDSLSIL